MISMQENDEIFKGGLEEHPKSRIVFGNAVMLFWFALGAISCWYIYPVLGVVYLIVAFIMVYIVLRKVVCVNCYYYDKWCGLGWGKLAAAMFKKGKIDDFPKSIGVKLAPATYGILMIVPMILIIVSIIQLFSWYKVCVLVLLLLVSFYSSGTSRKFSCSQCKMKLICPGSSIKKEKNIK